MAGISINNACCIDVGQLPSIPHVLLKLIEACHRPDISFDELSDIIQKDVGLSARIIAVANSPAYTQWNKSRDFNRLLVVLGLNTIKTIAITTAVHQFFSQFDTNMGFWMGRFWRISLSCACASKLLARLTGYQSVDEAYLAGLLHRVGQLVLVSQEPVDYPAALLSAETDLELERRERALFGTTGNEVGALMIRQWDPDSLLGDAVLYQSESAEAVLDTPRLVKLVNFAHKLSSQRTIQEGLFHEASLLFGLSQPVIEDLHQEVERGVRKAAESLGIRLDEGEGGEQREFCADGEEIRLKLARKVREFAQLDGVRQHLSGSAELNEALTATLQDLKILFGLTRSVCFLSDRDNLYLVPQASNCAGSEHVHEFRIQLKPGRNLVAEALVSRSSRSTLDRRGEPVDSVVDRQLAGLLDSEGILCIPLYTETGDVGVLVAGVGYREMERLNGQTDLLLYFAEAVSRTLQQRQRLIRERDDAIEQERKRKQNQLKKLVHEANNPLSIIKNYLQVLAIRLGDESGVQDQLNILNEEIERVADIVLRMRDQTIPSELPQGTVDVNELLQDLVGIFRVSHFATHRIVVNEELDPAMPPILTNRNSLKQILTNLIRNATEAMKGGGSLSLTTRDLVNVDGVQYVELVLADTGPGIPPEVLSNIFRPVRSAKGREHSGLGLTIVKNLVADLNGSISCRNRSEGGAEFVIMLPRKLEKM